MASGLSKKDLSIILLAIALAAVLVAEYLRPREPIVPPRLPTTVDTKALESALQKVASDALAAPGLTNEQLTVRAAPATVEARQQEIVELAQKLGGSALKSIDNGQPKVLARLPAAKAAEFRKDLSVNSLASEATEDQWFEVIVLP